MRWPLMMVCLRWHAGACLLHLGPQFRDCCHATVLHEAGDCRLAAHDCGVLPILDSLLPCQSECQPRSWHSQTVIAFIVIALKLYEHRQTPLSWLPHLPAASPEAAVLAGSHTAASPPFKAVVAERSGERCPRSSLPQLS